MEHVGSETVRLRIFLSYSRRDAPEVADIRSFLDQNGFETLIDIDDILPEEDWKRRLERLIDTSDVVVFFLSPDSLASEHCGWEVEHAARRGKRLLPVVLRDAAQEFVPSRLQQLNYLFLRGEIERRSNITRLAETLRINVAWLRYQTDLQDRALRWEERGRPPEELLAGTTLTEAAAHLLQLPKDAPSPTDLVREYVQASLDQDEATKLRAIRDAEDRAEAEKRRRLAAESRQLAASSLQEATELTDVSALLAIESWRRAPSMAARRALMARAFDLPRLDRYIAAPTRFLRPGAKYQLRDGIVFSDDGRLLVHVVEPTRMSVALWTLQPEVQQIAEIPITEGNDQIRGLALAADGTIFVTTERGILSVPADTQRSVPLHLPDLPFQPANLTICCNPLDAGRLAVANDEQLAIVQLGSFPTVARVIALTGHRRVDLLQWLTHPPCMLVHGRARADISKDTNRDVISVVDVAAGHVARRYMDLALPYGRSGYLFTADETKGEVATVEIASGEDHHRKKVKEFINYSAVQQRQHDLAFVEGGRVKFRSVEAAFQNRRTLFRELSSTAFAHRHVETVVANPGAEGPGYASLGYDGSVVLWGRSSGHPLARRLVQAGDTVEGRLLAFDLAGSQIIRCSEEGDLWVWRLADLALVAQAQSIRLAAFASGTIPVVLTRDGDLATLTGAQLRKFANLGYVHDCAISNAGLVSVGRDGLARLYDLTTGIRSELGWLPEYPEDWRRSPHGPRERYERAIAIDETGSMLAISLSPTTIGIFQLAPGLPKVATLRTEVTDISLHWEEPHLVVTGTESMEMWAAREASLVWRYATGSSIGVKWVATMNAVQRVVAAKAKYQPGIHLFDGRSLTPITSIPQAEQEPTGTVLKFSPDGTMLAVDEGKAGVALYSFDPDDWVKRVAAMAGRELSEAERRLYIDPDGP